MTRPTAILCDPCRHGRLSCPNVCGHMTRYGQTKTRRRKSNRKWDGAFHLTEEFLPRLGQPLKPTNSIDRDWHRVYYYGRTYNEPSEAHLISRPRWPPFTDADTSYIRNRRKSCFYHRLQSIENGGRDICVWHKGQSVYYYSVGWLKSWLARQTQFGWHFFYQSCTVHFCRYTWAKRSNIGPRWRISRRLSIQLAQYIRRFGFDVAR